MLLQRRLSSRSIDGRGNSSLYRDNRPRSRIGGTEQVQCRDGDETVQTCWTVVCESLIIRAGIIGSSISCRSVLARGGLSGPELGSGRKICAEICKETETREIFARDPLF
jgi:hypothetical protein